MIVIRKENMSVETQTQQNIEFEKPRYYENAYDLIKSFEASPCYQKAFDSHINDLQRANKNRDYNDPDLRRKVAEAFYGSEEYIEALHGFYQDNKLDLDKIPREAQEGITKYFDYIEKTYNPTLEMIRFRAIDREQEIEEMQELSHKRDVAHALAARAIYGDRIDPDEDIEIGQNLMVGRQLVHLLACDYEIDIPASDREKNKLFARRQNAIAADNLFNR